MVSVLLVGIGGFAGAIARYVVDARVSAWTGGALPWGTFIINVSGSFLIGVLFVLLTERATLAAELRGPLMIGFLGAYTTFSTLALESWRLIEDGSWLLASIDLVGSVIIGLIAVTIGIGVGRAIG
ncbi:MAG TPA: fluoride efflux transporter CrcB [Candidatus Limnocylindria bacterium]|nr:fluoride efflux transporter CrcB [Candidatus Limnocylindria bacterium]